MRENPPFMDLVHFEDFVMGERYVYGAYEMKLAEMIAFAEQFDPEKMPGPHFKESDLEAQALFH